MNTESAFKEISFLQSCGILLGTLLNKPEDGIIYTYQDGSALCGMRTIILTSHKGKPCLVSFHTSGLFERLDSPPFDTKHPGKTPLLRLRAGIREFERPDDALRTFENAVKAQARGDYNFVLEPVTPTTRASRNKPQPLVAHGHRPNCPKTHTIRFFGFGAGARALYDLDDAIRKYKARTGPNPR